MLAETDSYETVAREYYDQSRHPTCANFRYASRRLLSRLVPRESPEHTCEVGAGDSLMAELFFERDRKLTNLLLTDASLTMLRHSRHWSTCGAGLAVASTHALPLSDGEKRLLVGSLADPYDDEDFWAEARRVLSPGGHCLITTPSYAWASTFRIRKSLASAEFELADGRRAALPSWIRPVEQERGMIERSGFTVVQQDAIRLEELPAPISPKLRGLSPFDDVVIGYLARAI